MFKSKYIETDAAPSRPRAEEEIVESSSETSSDEDDDPSQSKDGKNPNLGQELPKFHKSRTDQSSSGGNQYVQSTNINIVGGSGIQIGHQYHFYSGGQKAKTVDHDEDGAGPPPSKPQVPPPHIEKTFKNRSPAQKTDFVAIKFEIGTNWKKAAESLGFSEANVQQYYDRYKEKGNTEVFYQLLLRWRETQPRTTATVGILCEALWNCNETSAANILAKIHPDK